MERVSLAACATRQDNLRHPARDLGKFLFAERPSHFRERMDAYWRDRPRCRQVRQRNGGNRRICCTHTDPAETMPRQNLPKTCCGPAASIDA